MSDIPRFRGDTTPVLLTLSGLTDPLTTETFTLTCADHEHPKAGYTPEFQIAGTIIDAAAWKVQFDFTETEADFIGVYWYDIEMVDVAGKKLTPVKGRLIYRQDITK